MVRESWEDQCVRWDRGNHYTTVVNIGWQSFYLATKLKSKTKPCPPPCCSQMECPRGFVRSPALFNLSICKFLPPPANFDLLSYAGNRAIASQYLKIQKKTSRLQRYIWTTQPWDAQKHMKAPLIHPYISPHQTNTNPTLNPNITLLSQPLLASKHPSVFGITFDTRNIHSAYK